MVGAFLRALHATPAAVHAGTGVPDAAATRDHLLGRLVDMRERVLPLLPADRRAAGAALLDEVAEPVEACLVHGDLGPTHLLVADDRVSGVIDWSDAVIGDPGLDLAWTLNGTPAAFADALTSSYGVTPALRSRGLLWHQLGPWWEVLAGVDYLGDDYVESGLTGVLSRL